MAQVRKYQNAAGPIPKKKWKYNNTEYEVDEGDLKNLNRLNMSVYKFDENLPNGSNGTPTEEDLLAKKIGLISEDQYNAKYNPTPLSAATIIAEKTPKSNVVSEKKFGRFFRGSSSLEGQRAFDALFKANQEAGGWGMTNMALKAIEDGNDVYRGSDGSIVIEDSERNNITKNYIPKGVTATVDDGQF